MADQRGMDRRQVLRAGAVLGLLAVLNACGSPFAGRRLAVASGNTQGVYYNLAVALADVWRTDLGLADPPQVQSTAGSLDNLRRLAAGDADVAFSQIDAVADAAARTDPGDPRAPRALARIYDDVVHLVVPADSAILTPADLRGTRVSIGARESGVAYVAERLLGVLGLRPGNDLSAEQLGLAESAEALANGRIDAFFWVGGLPTLGVVELAEREPIRLVDLQSLVAPARDAYPEYVAGTVPATTYGIPEPVTSLLVRNVLLVPAEMPDDLAAALVESLFTARQTLADSIPVALTIDPRAAIGTQPVPLHPGAERFYREEKVG